MLLRPYQEVAVSDACKALDKHNNTLVVAPTGAGKTIMLSALVGKRHKRASVFLSSNTETNWFPRTKRSSSA